MTQMTVEAREKRNAYMRDYWKRNPDKQREIKARYWNKKAAEAAAEKGDIKEDAKTENK